MFPLTRVLFGVPMFEPQPPEVWSAFPEVYGPNFEEHAKLPQSRGKPVHYRLRIGRQ